MNSHIICNITKIAEKSPNNIALTEREQNISYAALLERVNGLAQWLQANQVKTLALYADNGIEWVIVDLACLSAGITLVPVPPFFTAAQRRHVLINSGADSLIFSNSLPLEGLAIKADVNHAPPLNTLQFSLIRPQYNALKDNDAHTHETAKITYTSGSTGEPKGVCLSSENLDLVVFSLLDAIAITESSRHLCTLPLSILLENVAGIYLPLMMGAQIFVDPMDSLGIRGSSHVDEDLWAKALANRQPETIILTPELLKLLVNIVSKQHDLLPNLKFVAVGGGRVATQVIEEAEELKIPVYEGYGLSECGSVVSLNRPYQNKPGSVGKPLDHVQVRLSDESEILIKGSTMQGYLGKPALEQDEIATGDLGYFDEEGHLFIQGRKKNLIITAFGRNFSPEWVESELTSAPIIQQAFVIGDGLPSNLALISPAHPSINNSQITSAIATINSTLPDYAQISKWQRVTHPFSKNNALLTSNGRLKREAIQEKYAHLVHPQANLVKSANEVLCYDV